MGKFYSVFTSFLGRLRFARVEFIVSRVFQVGVCEVFLSLSLCVSVVCLCVCVCDREKLIIIIL